MVSVSQSRNNKNSVRSVCTYTLRERTGAKASPFRAGIQRRKLGSWYCPSADTARLRPSECLSCGIERGTPAPMSGQSDNFRQLTTLSEHPSPEVVGRCGRSTSESADERRKPRGNDGNRRFEDRSTGGLALPVDAQAFVHEPETPNEPACGAGRWESYGFSRGRMSKVIRKGPD